MRSVKIGVHWKHVLVTFVVESGEEAGRGGDVTEEEVEDRLV